MAVNAGKVGSGYFVGPGLVLTCAHVIERETGRPAESISISWHGESYKADLSAENYFPKPGPDFALLQVAIEDNPCVLMDARFSPVQIGDSVVSYGFPERDRSGDIATFEVEGPAPFVGLVKLKGGRAEPGMSGAPVLSLATGSVCGILRYTRDRHSDLGGRFLSMHDAIRELPIIGDRQDLASIERWLALLTDSQLYNGERKYACPRLREYLSLASAEANVHPYEFALAQAPPLATVYVRQSATLTEADSPELDPSANFAYRESDTPVARGTPIPASNVVDNHQGAIVIGGPGAGKSSLLNTLH